MLVNRARTHKPYALWVFVSCVYCLTGFAVDYARGVELVPMREPYSVQASKCTGPSQWQWGYSGLEFEICSIVFGWWSLLVHALALNFARKRSPFWLMPRAFALLVVFHDCPSTSTMVYTACIRILLQYLLSLQILRTYAMILYYYGYKPTR